MHVFVQIAYFFVENIVPESERFAYDKVKEDYENEIHPVVEFPEIIDT